MPKYSKTIAKSRSIFAGMLAGTAPRRATSADHTSASATALSSVQAASTAPNTSQVAGGF
jgi:hypothetical protein